MCRGGCMHNIVLHFYCQGTLSFENCNRARSCLQESHWISWNYCCIEESCWKKRRWLAWWGSVLHFWMRLYVRSRVTQHMCHNFAFVSWCGFWLLNRRRWRNISRHRSSPPCFLLGFPFVLSDSLKLHHSDLQKQADPDDHCHRCHCYRLHPHDFPWQWWSALDGLHLLGLVGHWKRTDAQHGHLLYLWRHRIG